MKTKKLRPRNIRSLISRRMTWLQTSQKDSIVFHSSEVNVNTHITEKAVKSWIIYSLFSFTTINLAPPQWFVVEKERRTLRIISWWQEPEDIFEGPACVLSCFSYGTELLWTIPCQSPLPRDSPGKNTGVGCHAHLQVIFLI